MAIEREIRFVVTDGEPPPDGRRIVQAYLWRRPALRIRLVEGREARLGVKLARATGCFEWECRLPAALGRALLALPVPRVAKHRLVQGRLEIDRYDWPFPLVVCECELEPEDAVDLGDPEARGRFMEARRPHWVRAWRDVTDDPAMTAAAIAR